MWIVITSFNVFSTPPRETQEFPNCDGPAVKSSEKSSEEVIDIIALLFEKANLLAIQTLDGRPRLEGFSEPNPRWTFLLLTESIQPECRFLQDAECVSR